MKLESKLEEILFEAIICRREEIPIFLHRAKVEIKELIKRNLIGAKVLEPESETNVLKILQRKEYNKYIDAMCMRIEESEDF